MSRAQRVVVVIGVVLVALMGVYWPWYDATAILWSPVSTDYYSVLAPPDRNHAPNFPQLLAQCALVVGLTAAVVMRLRRHRDAPPLLTLRRQRRGVVKARGPRAGVRPEEAGSPPPPWAAAGERAPLRVAGRVALPRAV